MNREYYGITLQSEKDYSAVSTELDLWDDHLPLKPGDLFPTEAMRRRADINKTMNMLVENDLAEILRTYISDMPDLSAFQAQRVSNIVSSLPIFDMIVRSWKSILTPCFQGIEINGVSRPDIWKQLYPQIENIIKNIFTCCDRATVVYKSGDRVVTRVFTDKNILLFRTAMDERVITITNVIKADKKQYLECISYLPDGKSVQDKFEYSNKRIGKQLVSNKFVESDRKALFAKNGSGDSEYGYPEIIGSMAASLGTIRAFATLARSIEQAREEIRVVPSSSIRVDPLTGASLNIQGGTVGYDELNKDASHDVAIVKPTIDFEGLIKALEEMLKQVSVYSGVSGVILGSQTLGGNASGRTLLATCIPTMLLANGYIERLKNEISDLAMEVVKYTEGEEAATEITVLVNTPDAALTSIVDSANGYAPKEQKEEAVTDEI